MSVWDALVLFSDFNVLFFFFKQKTAYEMRISDWSSDVCSSDLLGQAVGDDQVDAFLVAGPFVDLVGGERGRPWSVVGAGRRRDPVRAAWSVPAEDLGVVRVDVVLPCRRLVADVPHVAEEQVGLLVRGCADEIGSAHV